MFGSLAAIIWVWTTLPPIIKNFSTKTGGGLEIGVSDRLFDIGVKLNCFFFFFFFLVVGNVADCWLSECCRINLQWFGIHSDSVVCVLCLCRFFGSIDNRIVYVINSKWGCVVDSILVYQWFLYEDSQYRSRYMLLFLTMFLATYLAPTSTDEARTLVGNGYAYVDGFWYFYLFLFYSLWLDIMCIACRFEGTTDHCQLQEESLWKCLNMGVLHCCNGKCVLYIIHS